MLLSGLELCTVSFTPPFSQSPQPQLTCPVSPTDQWNNVKAGFLDHIDDINKDLIVAGLPILKSAPTSTPKTSEPTPSRPVVSDQSLPVLRENLEKTCPTEAAIIGSTSPESGVSAPWAIVPDVRTVGSEEV